MKITLDIPDNVRAAFFCFVGNAKDWPSMYMQTHNISTDELYDGNEIKIPQQEVVDND